MTHLALATLAGLALGFGLGVALPPDLPDWVTAVNTFAVESWTQALTVVVFPLVLSQLFLAVAGAGCGRAAVRTFSLHVPVVFLGLLAIGVAVTAGGTQAALTLPWFADLTLVGSGVERATVAAEPPSSVSWFDALLPQRLLAAAAGGDLLTLMLVAVVVGVITRRIGVEQRASLMRVGAAISEGALIATQWLIRLAPAAVFGVSFLAARRSGVDLGAVLFSFVIIRVTVSLVLIGVLFGIVAVAGISLVRYARAMAPPLLVAVTTRSSLATLPVLMDRARSALGLSQDLTSTVLPLTAALLKLSRTVSDPIKLLFLMHVLDLPLTWQQLLVFTVTIMLLSPATVGIPSPVGSTRSLPAFLAAGVPVEYYMLLQTTSVITDPVATMINTTGYMSATVLVDRAARGRATVGAGETPALRPETAAP